VDATLFVVHARQDACCCASSLIKPDAVRSQFRTSPVPPQSHYGQGRPDEARACFERAIALEPANAKARFNLGNVLHDRIEYQAAVILFRDAAALDPDFADAYFNLATTCEQLGLVKEAQRHWQRYLARDPTGD
jgi:tetratricopeptide (TPR) repeat protein